MPETSQSAPNVRPGEEHFVHDPAQAELMAYAEKPHREYAAALRKTANGEITDQLEEYYQKNPDQRTVTYDQRGDRAYETRDDLLGDKRDYLKAADKALALGELRAWGVSKRYRQNKESESAAPMDEISEVTTHSEPHVEGSEAGTETGHPEQTEESQTHTGVARISRSNIPTYDVNEEDLIKKTKELVESGQITEPLASSKNAGE